VFTLVFDKLLLYRAPSAPRRGPVQTSVRHTRLTRVLAVGLHSVFITNTRWRPYDGAVRGSGGACILTRWRKPRRSLSVNAERVRGVRRATVIIIMERPSRVVFGDPIKTKRIRIKKIRVRRKVICSWRLMSHCVPEIHARVSRYDFIWTRDHKSGEARVFRAAEGIQTD